MKTKYSFLCLVMALPLLLTSCLHDQEDVFDESASTRMQSYLSNAKSTLESSEYGWAFDYYPNRNLTYGGFAYGVTFDDTAATVACSLAPSTVEKSLYRMTTDDGPVLSFDTYNSLMHFFATPTSNRYEGYDGDFEFVIDSIGADRIKVHGKRTLNTMYLYKLDKSIEEYTEEAAEMSSNLILGSASGEVGSTQVSADIDVDAQSFTYTDDQGNTVSDPFTVTDKGIRFYTPVTIGGKTFSELAFDAATLQLTGTTTDGSPIQLQGKVPDGYMQYADYAGDYTLNYNKSKRSIDVTLTPAGDGSTYILSGLNKNFTLTLTYEKSSGRLILPSQQVGEYEGSQVWFCAWGREHEGGYLTWDDGTGMYLTWNGDSENPVLTFSSYGSSFTTDSFLLWLLDDEGNSVGSMSGVTDWYVNGSYQLPYMTNMVKKK